MALLLRQLQWRRHQASVQSQQRVVESIVETVTLQRLAERSNAQTRDGDRGGRTLETQYATGGAGFSSDGRYIALSLGDHTLRVYHTASGRQIQRLSGHLRTAWAVCFRPLSIWGRAYGYQLASGCLGGRVVLWDMLSGEKLLQGDYNYPISSISFHPDGSLLLATSGPSLYFWDLTQRLSAGDRPYDHRVNLPFDPQNISETSVLLFSAVHPSGQLLFTCSSRPSRPGETPPSCLIRAYDLHGCVYDLYGCVNVDLASPPRLQFDDVQFATSASCHLDPQGRMMTMCVSAKADREDMRIVVYSLLAPTFGQLLHSVPVPQGHFVAALRLTPQCTHLAVALDPRLWSRGNRVIFLLFRLVGPSQQQLQPASRIEKALLTLPEPLDRASTNVIAFHPEPGWGFSLGMSSQAILYDLIHGPTLP